MTVTFKRKWEDETDVQYEDECTSRSPRWRKCRNTALACAANQTTGISNDNAKLSPNLSAVSQQCFVSGLYNGTAVTSRLT